MQLSCARYSKLIIPTTKLFEEEKQQNKRNTQQKAN